MFFGVSILCKSLRFSHSLDFAQNPQQNSELKHLIKFQLELEFARNISIDRARAQACSKSLKVVELEPKSSEWKAWALSKLELLATLWVIPWLNDWTLNNQWCKMIRPIWTTTVLILYSCANCFSFELIFAVFCTVLIIADFFANLLCSFCAIFLVQSFCKSVNNTHQI